MSEETQGTTATNTTETPVYDKGFVEKLLAEKKNAMKGVDELKQQVQAYEAKFKEIEEKNFKEKEDYKSLAEVRQKEVIEWQERYAASETRLQQGAKYAAIKREFDKMGVRDPKTIETLLSIVKIEAIKYDADTQTVVGAEDEVKRIKDSLPMVFVQASSKMSHDAAGGTTESYTLEKLKEMSKNKAPIQEIRDYQTKLMQGLAKK